MLGRALTRYLSKYYNVFPAFKMEKSNSSNPLLLDVTSLKDVASTFRTIEPDYVVNCAAYTNVDQSEINKELSYNVNVNGLRNIISASLVSTKIIHISTDYVFDGNKTSYSEEDTPNPISYYGKVKLEAENLLRTSRRKNIILRTSVIYDESPNSFFSWVNSSLLNDNAIQVVTDQVSNPTWTWSISEAIYKLILNNLEGLYHFAGDDILSRYDFALKIAKIYNYNLDRIIPIETKKLKQLAKRPLSSVLNNDKIKNHIDIEHPSMDSIIKKIKENE